ncbi:MAG: glycosyltransferase [Austwickia sp.]|nr:glycosyltransferase [Austwickia sp.]
MSACDVTVLTSGHDVADARLHREVAALMRAGLSVEVLGLGDSGDAPPEVQAVRTWPRPGLAGRATLAARMALVSRGRVLLTLDPDSALAAYGVSRRGRRTGLGCGPGSGPGSGRPALVVDVHEDYARLLADRAWTRRAGGSAGTLARGLVGAFTRVAARADLTVVADEHVPPLTARRRLVVPNLPDPAMLPEPAAREPRPRALYVGDVRASRGLFAMLEAIRAAPDWTVDIVGPVAPADADALTTALAADPALAARVQLHGRRPPSASFALARGAWVGLLLLADTPAFAEALPSKLHEYLACGLAVVTTDLPRSAALVRESGAGAVVPAGGSDADVGAAVAEILRGWSADPTSLDAARAGAGEYARVRRAAGGGYDELAAAVTELAQR